MTVAAGSLTGVVDASAIVTDVDPGRWASLVSAPEAVLAPATTGEVASILAWASAEGVGVVPAGSGHRLGPTPLSGRFVVLTTGRLTGIEQYEAADLTITAAAGTKIATLDAALRAQRQWLPFDPPAAMERTTGGLVASGLSGPLATLYGALRNHVLGATVVTGDGRVLRLGGRVVKNVAGFDLLRPLVGSRGRLAVVTSVCLRTFPVPAVDRLLVLRGDRLDELVEPALAVGTAPVLPASVSVIRDAEGPRLVVRLHGAEETVEADRRTIEGHVGRTFEPVDASHGVAEPNGMAEAGVTVAVTVLPSGLDNVVTAVELARADAVAIDSYAARVRARFDALDEGRIDTLRRVAEQEGGALRVESAPPGVEGLEVGSRPSTAEERLATKVRRAFDPKEVLWRGR